jgi:curved DNA-binding protein CbpA
MSDADQDPYAVLGVAPDVSDIELRRVYRGLVKRHHPDHNGGSTESANRFARIQDAYAEIARHRRPAQPDRTANGTAGGAAGPWAAAPHEARGGAGDSGMDHRIETLEREVAAMRAAQQRRAEEQARLARERARSASGNPDRTSSNQTQRRPTPEELGYYATDDSFTKIIDDAADQLSERLRKGDAKRVFARRLSDLLGHED